ncbi:hypothetical protein [Streptomyces sp. NPDC001500]
MTSTRTGPDPTAQDLTAPTEAEADRPWAPRPRGRHRRPRPHKVLFAAGGLALAAGVLSLVRLTPDAAGPAGVGAAEADPQPDPFASTGADTGPGRSVDTAATVAPSPSAPSAMGGASADPAPEAGLLPGAPGSPTSVALTPGVTYTPAAPGPAATQRAGTPHAPDAPRPAPSSSTAPRPSRTPAPAPATTPPAPQPSSTGTPRRPGVCVPVVGLCVDPLTPLPKL